MRQIEMADKVEITVKRPNGITETIVHPSLKALTNAQFEQIKRDTKAAGRGEVLFYRNKTKLVTVNAAPPADAYDRQHSAIAKMMRMGD